MEQVLECVRKAAEAAARGPTGSFAEAPVEVREAWEAFVALFTRKGVPSMALDREAIGRLVREVWVAFARTQPAPKPSWLQPWEDLTEDQREVDRRIGETIAVYTLAMITSLPVYFTRHSLTKMQAVLAQLGGSKT